MDDFLKFVEQDLGEGIWIPLYKDLDKDDGSEDGAFYSCLVSPSETETLMQNYGWDLALGGGGPSIVTCGSDIWYESNCSKFLPLVIYREFHGTRKFYFEILQELVLYLNLFHDFENKKYAIYDENGTEIEVIRYSDSEFSIRKSFLSAFMSARQYNLLLFFEKTRHENNVFRQRDEVSFGSLVSYTRYWDNSYVKGFSTFTRICGKKLFYCTERNEENTSPFSLEKKYEEFIINGDAHDHTLYSCNPSLLANYFGGNSGNPHYLTPVYFKREVLQKYYSLSTEYEVGDSSIYKKGFWRLRIDNNSPDHVCVFLGDLGRDIPHLEQVYWKSFSLAPEGRKMSETCFRRSMLGQFSSAESPDFRFKFIFEQFQEKWHQVNDWHLFLPLSEGDKHCFQTLHSLTSNEQSEFDSQILSLVKTTIDSINVKVLKQKTGIDENGSIKLLEKYLKGEGVDLDVNRFLGGLQGLRSTGVAHRRGSKYEKTIKKLGILDGDLKGAFNNILSEMTSLITAIGDTLLNRATKTP
ncbi:MULTISPECIES: hypothetical protein [Cyanophyceae]|uniref:hypothetical protein n=1 Tax=Cyanophyceae TaxID=3028117 RepID=UPI00168241D1|nr:MULTISPECIES: hypothetical protein [Cyanophyceae]MBD1918075.1 hypothetical protein [Phormidium sp. FACHB-77]MBD2030108.1 hypothetical protein [Phormidium sp. FACHB-322]MBD2051521.1 hypothetical protein [Leptolyngbya sp. FACHB-60]